MPISTFSKVTSVSDIELFLQRTEVNLDATGTLLSAEVDNAIWVYKVVISGEDDFRCEIRDNTVPFIEAEISPASPFTFDFGDSPYKLSANVALNYNNTYGWNTGHIIVLYRRVDT